MKSEKFQKSEKLSFEEYTSKIQPTSVLHQCRQSPEYSKKRIVILLNV